MAYPYTLLHASENEAFSFLVSQMRQLWHREVKQFVRSNSSVGAEPGFEPCLLASELAVSFPSCSLVGELRKSLNTCSPMERQAETHMDTRNDLFVQQSYIESSLIQTLCGAWAVN